MKTELLIVLIVSCMLLCGQAGATSVITWDTPVPISSVTDVLTTGYDSVVEAWNVGGSPNTVSGVDFAYGVSLNSTGVYGGAVYTLSYAGTSIDPNYDDLLRGGQASCNHMDLGKGGSLAHGEEYILQVWVQDGRSNIGFDRETVLITGTNSVHVPHLDTITGNGYFVTGTFTYDANETFGSTYDLRVDLTGTDASDGRSPSDIFALVNAYAVYHVPEPATIGLLSMGILFAARSRKRS